MRVFGPLVQVGGPGALALVVHGEKVVDRQDLGSGASRGRRRLEDMAGLALHLFFRLFVVFMGKARKLVLVN